MQNFLNRKHWIIHLSFGRTRCLCTYFHFSIQLQLKTSWSGMQRKQDLTVLEQQSRLSVRIGWQMATQYQKCPSNKGFVWNLLKRGDRWRKIYVASGVSPSHSPLKSNCMPHYVLQFNRPTDTANRPSSRAPKFPFPVATLQCGMVEWLRRLHWGQTFEWLQIPSNLSQQLALHYKTMCK